MTLPVWLKYLPHAIGLGLIVFLGSKIYGCVYDQGRQEILTKWEADKENVRKATEILKKKVEDAETLNRQQSKENTHALAEADKKYAVAVVNLRAEYDKRMQSSSTREASYKRLAEAGIVECGNLASHATELDRTLEEGRYLVRELRETLGLRDQQVILVGRQLLADRSLISEAGSNDGR